MENKSKAARVSVVKDRLSALPDDILTHNILCLLPLKEAGRTCILARRWRFMPLYLLNLDFDAFEEVASVPVQERVKVFGGGGEAASKYADWVDQVIGSYMGMPTLHRFRVCFWLDNFFSNKTGPWLQFCVDKGVEVLEVDALQNRQFALDTVRCELPLFGPGQLRNLRLLKSLILKGVNIASDALEHFLLGCQSLESLRLFNVESLTYVNVQGPISKLKSIDISNCCRRVRTITISAPTPDLVSFFYPSCVRNLHLEHAPRIANLSLGVLGNYSTSYNLLSHPLLHYIAQLETLHLNIENWHKVTKWLPHLPSLSRLKCLMLKICGISLPREGRKLWPKKLHGVASLIKAARCVQYLRLEALLHEDVEITEEFASLHLEHLRVIELMFFQDQGAHYALASHLVKGAVASAAPLEKLIIDCRVIVLPTGENFPGTQLEKTKSRAREVLEQELPPTVELVLI